ncbi:MAG: fibronectin type III domain-containing protein [Spirochaetaceae bacterium]|nr:fibronectin type III domain-containing protein [Spirochaetaceae bacterium]
MKNTIKLIGIIAVILFGFAVIACDNSGFSYSSVSGGGSGGGSSNTPSAPRSLVAAACDGLVMLSWTAPQNGTIIGYQVSSNNGSTWITIPDPSITSYTFFGLNNDAVHNFSVRALNTNGSGSRANISATPSGANSYIITNTGANIFSVHRGGNAVVTPGQSITSAIGHIRDHAAGNNVTIRFQGSSPLNIGTDNINFTGAWGIIRLVGRITSADPAATISVDTGVTVISGAIIANTAGGNAITNADDGTVIVGGGEVPGDITNAADGIVIVFGGEVSGDITNADDGTVIVGGGEVLGDITNAADGDVIVFGGEVSGDISNAVDGDVIVFGGEVSGDIANAVAGTVIVSEGIISGDITNAGTLTVDGGEVSGAIVNSGALIIEGGTVSNTITNATGGTVAVSGGTVNVTGAATHAIVNNSTAANSVAVSGGVVIAAGTGSYAINNVGAGPVAISATGTVRATGADSFAINNAVAGAVTVSGGTVSATGANSSAINNAAATGTVTVSAGTVSAAANNSRAITNASTGTVNINGGTITANTGDTAAAIHSIATGSAVYLRNAPTITGIIHVNIGILRVATFTPGNQRFILLMPSISAGIAVDGGAAFDGNFDLHTNHKLLGWVMSITGSDLTVTQ